MESFDKHSLYQKIWELTREQLSVKYPFFRKLLWDFSFQESEDTQTAGTDGSIIYFNPDFVIRSFQNSATELEELFLHMLYHCLFLHPVMDIPADPVLWNLACDTAVQRILHNEKKEWDSIKIYQKFSASEISEQTDPAASAPESDSVITLDDHAFWKYVHRDQFLEKIHKTLAGMSGVSSLGLYGNGGRGSSPGNRTEELSVEEKGKYDFHRFLRRFAVHREEIHTDTQSFDYIPYIYGLEHYGNIPLIEYLEYQEVTRLEELVIAIDTSGSCSSDTVRRFMEETYGILSDQENFFRKMNLYIIQCDCLVQDVAHITCEKDWKDYLKNLRIHGRSGTDFRPVFDYIEKLRSERKLKNLKGLLYFTDGDGIYPEKPTDYETAFVFYKEKVLHQKVPAWAVRLYLDTEKS